eukprot:TRINITY_DN12553_c0_g1_i1.p1 TRINITY_DN12553_c0_g1~~TRINITY_DN12553_c0_g1_i1.p1  ORF type:complete len:236 (-),score=49.54 TRINITY_DN12553_c0_g1_i1:450-1157(-)
MASLLNHVVTIPVVCLASSSQSTQEQQLPAKVSAGSKLSAKDMSRFSSAITTNKKAEAGSVQELNVSRRENLVACGALMLSFLGLSSNQAQAQEGAKSQEAEQAAQVKEDSGRVAERRKQQTSDVQTDVVWGRRIPQISRKSTEAEQASQVKEDSANVAERRKRSSASPDSSIIGKPRDELFKDEEKPVLFWEFPVAEKSQEAEAADQVKQDSGRVAERRQKSKEEELKPASYVL